MAVPSIKTSFISGEIAPNLYGHTDLARFNSGATTMRNMFVSFRGGAYSRGGTAFVGYSKQTGRSYPPRVIPFQFSINQGLVLEFGHRYMRVIYQGGFVLENGLSISNITQSNPGVISAAATGANSATPVNTNVTVSYAPGEQVTLAGGAYSVPAVVGVVTTRIIGINGGFTGSGYAPGNTINISGGTQTTQAVVTISTTKVGSATIAAAGTGGANGLQIVTGTTGTGTKFQAQVTIVAGVITAINNIVIAGNYTVNPTAPTVEPVTGAGLSGAQLNVSMVPAIMAITNPGVFTANPPGGVASQLSTSGSGVGATFINVLMGVNAATFVNQGVYTAFPPNPVSQLSTNGAGRGIEFNVTQGSVVPFSDDEWVYLDNISGMTELNGRTVVVKNSTPTSFEIYDVFGRPIDTSGYSPYGGGGVASRVYTVPSPYNEEDLDYLKFTQSADVMSLALLNQISGVEYQPYDLARSSNTNWSFTPVIPDTGVAAPASATVRTNSLKVILPSGLIDHAYYQYVITTVNEDATESIASPIGAINDTVNIGSTAGSMIVEWTPAPGAVSYNVYKASPGYDVAPPTGALFGFAGVSFGTQFIDSNITPDFAKTPPLRRNPFARGAVLSVAPTNGGAGYTFANVTINSTTGSGAIIVPVIQNATVVAYIVQSGGKDYAPTDTVSVNGDGAGASANLNLGPQSGTYPSVVAYFQQRRAYAYSKNKPDTYWMSQPGAFGNFDVRSPTIDSDAITGAPWSQQVNGIQFMVPMPGGLVVFTGLGAWLLGGGSSSALGSSPLTPNSQSAQPQASNGCSATVPPIRIDGGIVYVQSKGSIYRDFSYSVNSNNYIGADLTQNSAQLFTGFQTIQHAWCEEPNRLLWSIRDDGILRSLTYLPIEKVIGWSRHDTFGEFKTIAGIIELPVDAVYLGVQRVINNDRSYMIERMDNRLWSSIDDAWCVDAGAALARSYPDATIQLDSVNGSGSITGVSDLVGGSGYSASTYARIDEVDPDSNGFGAVPTLTIVAGVITAVTFAPGDEGQKYSWPLLVIIDPQNLGSGASARPILDTNVTITSNTAVFSPSNVGSAFRGGGGEGTVMQFISATEISVFMTVPVSEDYPDGDVTNPLPRPLVSGRWSLTRPTSTVSGYSHLGGSICVGLVDGEPIPPFVMPMNGVVNLPKPATSAVFGLPFMPQLQTTDINESQPTQQGRRKKIGGVTVRVERTLGISGGQNMPDGAALNPPQIAPQWPGMESLPIPEVIRPSYNSDIVPLYTGDVRMPFMGGWDTGGQVALQQDYPLPMAILAVMPSYLDGDTPETRTQPQGRKGGQEQ